MERLHVNYLREIIHRLRLGQSDRAISRDMHLSRHTIRKYRELASTAGYLNQSIPLPEAQVLEVYGTKIMNRLLGRQAELMAGVARLSSVSVVCRMSNHTMSPWYRLISGHYQSPV